MNRVGEIHSKSTFLFANKLKTKEEETCLAKPVVSCLTF